MSNPFVETKKMFAPIEKRFTGYVTSKEGTFLKVTSDAGVIVTCSGAFNIGEYVFVKGTTVIGVVKKEHLTTVYVD